MTTAEIARRVTILVISMGSGRGGDAQYLFACDILGTERGHVPRHAKVYRNLLPEYERLHAERIAAFREFKADVDGGRFPEPHRCVTIRDAELSAFLEHLGSEPGDRRRHCASGGSR